ncbi:MAG: 23S rRNA (guanosine(2251)-2'-O)-methyltransferase RlmB [Chloroflexi bacterium]|nr:MAG: 23S rRNA (guanosine(2251)-2'-O)-methyltransferase RlmB [Chloroflexota bacterium]
MAHGVTEIIYGRNPVLEALRSRQPIDRILLARGVKATGPVAEILDRAHAQNIAVEWVERSRLDRETRRHQGVIAQVRPFEYASVDDILALAQQRGEPPLILALDQVQDVHNLGSLIRTAEAVGVHGVILPERRTAPITPAVYKSSAGAVAHLLVARVTNLVRALKQLKEKGLWVVGLDMAGDHEYDALDWAMPVVVVVGSEGQGLGRLVRETCDFLVRIPMRGKIESLNAAVAGSIVLYTAWRRGAGRRTKFDN